MTSVPSKKDQWISTTNRELDVSIVDESKVLGKKTLRSHFMDTH